MKKWKLIIGAALVVAFMVSCGGGPQLPEKWEVSLVPAKGFEEAKGTAVINTKTGTDISIIISGLKAGEVYTVFFVNVKSKMFEGIGKDPFVLPVDAGGKVNFQGKIKKGVYKRFTKLAVFLNPDKKPVANPLGVKAKLGAILKTVIPKMVLEAKLR